MRYFKLALALSSFRFQDGEEVSRLKETIRKLRAGEHHEEGDGKEDTDG